MRPRAMRVAANLDLRENGADNARIISAMAIEAREARFPQRPLTCAPQPRAPERDQWRSRLLPRGPEVV